MVELGDEQFELLESADDSAGGVLMGRRTPVNVSLFEQDTLDVRDADAPVAMGDGTRFGRDFFAGQLLNIELDVLAPYQSPHRGLDVLNTLDQIKSAWSADRVRLSPGAVQVLRWRAAGRDRRAYGRPRRFSPVTANYLSGKVPVVADFQCVDDLVYADDRKVTTVGITPAANAWTTWPLTWPVLWRKAESGNEGTITVGGSRATWPAFSLHGPIAQPSIVIGGYGEIKLNTNLLYDQVLYIDTRPWSRGVRRDNGANLAASLDVRSTPLSQLRFPPGSYSVALKGTDPTGTSHLVVEHRDAFSSI